MSSTAPLRRRLTLPAMKASGLARSMASSIWSSDTRSSRAATAMSRSASLGGADGV